MQPDHMDLTVSVGTEPFGLVYGDVEEGVMLRLTGDGKGDGVVSTRSFANGETVMIGFLVGALSGNDSHATQVGARQWARHGGLGPKVNHCCDPNCGVRLNDGQAFDFVARRSIDSGEEVTFDYAMRNFTIEHFPTLCLCGAACCRGSVTGWKDLPATRKAEYGELVAPYLREMDSEMHAAMHQTMPPIRVARCGTRARVS